MKKVLIFGDFDLVHPGHIHFMREAKKEADELIVAVTCSSVINQLKGRKPMYSERERLKAVRAVPIVTRVLLGDKQLKSFSVIQRVRPNVICVGYDQRALEKELRAYIASNELIIPVRRLTAYHPETFKSSIRKNLVHVTA